MAEIWRARTETRWLKFQTIDLFSFRNNLGDILVHSIHMKILMQIYSKYPVCICKTCLWLRLELGRYLQSSFVAVSLLTSQPNRVKSQCDCRFRWLPATGCHIAIVPPSDVCWFINPMNTIVISAINHSEMGVASFKAGVPGQAEDLGCWKTEAVPPLC